MIVTLVGYRGTGKSSLAPRIAQSLGYQPIDSDRVIEQQEQKTIAEIFAESGEAGFRQVEARVMAELYDQDQLVVASGGGAILNPITREKMRSAGPVFWLTADPDEIVQRLQLDQSTPETRPSLTGLSPAEEVKTVLKKREPIYREVAHFEIATMGQTIDQIVEEILHQISAWKGTES